MRLIDADAFAEVLWCEYERRELFMNECAEKGMWETRYGTKIERNTIAEIVHGMDEVPTIDAVPVVHGEWQDTIVAFYRKCSVCGCCVEWDKKPFLFANGEYNYCPICGAKMDGGIDDE